MDTISKKDKIIFCTKADHEKPSKYELPPALPSEQRRGVVLPNGDINWTCPCLGGLPYGPCGFQFREFFSCLHATQDSDDVKAQECFPKFASMKECFKDFPNLYPDEDDSKIAGLDDGDTSQGQQSNQEPSKQN